MKEKTKRIIGFTLCVCMLGSIMLGNIMAISHVIFNVNQPEAILASAPEKVIELDRVYENKLAGMQEHISDEVECTCDECLSIQSKVNAEEVNAGVISTSARGMCVLEGNTGLVFYENNAYTQMPMASTTKIATAIVAIENCADINEMVSVNKAAVGIEGTSIYVREGEELTVKELLTGLMLASGNDAAVALACHVSGTEEAFVQLMNEFAINLGAKNTQFKNAHGLDANGHYTTAYDLALITAYAMKNPVFREISETKTAVIRKTNFTNERYLRNKNKLLFSQEGCVGVKTGFTDNAGRCLVNANETEDGMMIVSVVLNCGPMFEECGRLTQLVRNNFKLKEFVEPYNFVGNVRVESGDKPNINAVTIQGFKQVIVKAEEDNYKAVYELEEVVEAPVDKNQKLGTVKVLYNDEVIYEDGLYSIDAVENVDIKYMLKNILDNWFN